MYGLSQLQMIAISQGAAYMGTSPQTLAAVSSLSLSVPHGSSLLLYESHDLQPPLFGTKDTDQRLVAVAYHWAPAPLPLQHCQPHGHGHACSP